MKCIVFYVLTSNVFNDPADEDTDYVIALILTQNSRQSEKYNRIAEYSFL